MAGRRGGGGAEEEAPLLKGEEWWAGGRVGGRWAERAGEARGGAGDWRGAPPEMVLVVLEFLEWKRSGVSCGGG